MTNFQYISPDIGAYSGNVPNTAGKISIGSLSDGIMTNIDHSIISVNVDYTMNAASQLSFDVIETMNMVQPVVEREMFRTIVLLVLHKLWVQVMKRQEH
jgi:hypothetical protein